MKKLMNNDEDSFIKMMIEAKNTLLYTLLFPQIEIIEDKPENWVKQALFQSYFACHPGLFHHGYHFFGMSLGRNKYALLNNLQHYGFSEADAKNNFAVLETDFLANAILMQCVMASYDTVMQLLKSTNNKRITAYAIANKLQSNGYNQMQKQELINKNLSIAVAKKPDSVKSQDQNNFIRIANSFKSKEKNRKNILTKEKFIESFYRNNEIPLSHTDILYNFVDIIEDSFLKSFVQLYRKDPENENSKNAPYVPKIETAKGWGMVKKFNEIMTEHMPENLADKLYYQYKLENIFGLTLANCTAQNVAALAKDNKYSLGENSVYKILALFSKMPNAFTRQWFLQYAFGYLHIEPKARSNYFSTIMDTHAWAETIEQRPFNFQEWQISFMQFANYFNKLVFPAYEWYFFIVLWNTIENDKTVGKKTFTEKLMSMQKILAAYMSENYQLIADPFQTNLTINKNDINYLIKPCFDSFDGLPNVNYLLSEYKECNKNSITGIAELDRTFWQGENKNQDYKKIMGFYSLLSTF